MDIEPFDTAAEAVTFLRDDWLGDFPFASDSDLATALMIPAAVLTARTELTNAMGPPLHLITAPSAGTGKSLLATVLGAGVMGEVPGSAGYQDNEEECGKLVGAAIMEGWPVLFFDNLKSGSFLGFRDVTLTKLTTDITYTGRILGLTQSFKGPAGIVTVCTGNNVVVDGDMARRTLECRLVAPEGQNLAQRSFRRVR